MNFETYFTEFKQLIQDNKVILFAKGTKDRPACGFSAYTIEVLESYNIEFEVVNVLESPTKKEALKAFSNWPTIPQLYVQGEFIGGADITRELHENGELSSIVSK